MPPVETRFPPGKSGNAGGRPKGASIKAALLRELAANPDADGIGAKAVEAARAYLQASQGDTPEASRRAANLSQLIEHTDGKPRQTIEHEGTPVSISISGMVIEPPELPPAPDVTQLPGGAP